MNKTEINQLRRANAIPFKVVDWLEALTPIVAHDEFGVIYRGCILAEDGYGKYAAIIGTTDRLLKTAGDIAHYSTPYRILKVEKRIIPFSRSTRQSEGMTN